MKIVKMVGLGLLALVVVLVGVGMLLPRTVTLERSAVIDAPPCTVFAQLDDWRRFNAWSPWAAIDPATEYTFSDPASGVGSSMSWTSTHEKVGNGSQTVASVEPCTFIDIKLEFEGMPQSRAWHRLERADGGTKVTWGFEGDMGAGPVGRYFGLFMGKLIGPDYEKGLASLKTIAEALPKADFEGLSVETVQAEPVRWLALPASSSKDTGAVGQALGGAFGKIMGTLQEAAIQPAGAPLAIYVDEGETWAIRAGLPVGPDATLPEGAGTIDTLVGGPTLVVTHTGSYATLGETIEALKAYVAARQITTEGPMIEEYVSDPETTPEEKVQTRIHWRLAAQ